MYLLAIESNTENIQLSMEPSVATSVFLLENLFFVKLDEVATLEVESLRWALIICSPKPVFSTSDSPRFEGLNLAIARLIEVATISVERAGDAFW